MRNLHKIGFDYPDEAKWVAIWFMLVSSKDIYTIRWSPTKKKIEYRSTTSLTAWWTENNWLAYRDAVLKVKPYLTLNDFDPNWLR